MQRSGGGSLRPYQICRVFGVSSSVLSPSVNVAAAAKWRAVFQGQRCYATGHKPGRKSGTWAAKRKEGAKDKDGEGAGNEIADDSPEDGRGLLRPIRERLRDFIYLDHIAPSFVPRDNARLGATQNSMTRIESNELVEISTGEEDDPAQNDPLLWVGDGGGSGADSSEPLSLARPYGAVSPQAGDLIEVSTDSWRVQLLAVCLGSFRGVNHYYTNTGKWFASPGVRSLFRVTRFASAQEMAPVIAALPRESTGGGDSADDSLSVSAEDNAALDSMLNTLQDLKRGPTRAAGGGLIRKMNAFAEQAATIHMAHAGILDNAFVVLQQAASPEHPLHERRYMALDELAEVLLRKGGHRLHGARQHQAFSPGGIPIRNLHGTAQGQGDEFTPAAMYAVHRAIMNDELSFRPLPDTLSRKVDASADGHNVTGRVHSRSLSCLFCLASPEDLNIISYVEQMVRTFYDDPERIRAAGHLPDAALSQSRLGLFLLKARAAIDRSRQTRRWTPYGMLTSTGDQTPPPPPAPQPPLAPWEAAEERILRFMHLWAGYQRFPPASRLHWVGSAILRALERYSDAEYLTLPAGWTFLQEVGYLTPWDLSARYSLSLPDILPRRAGGLDRSLPEELAVAAASSSSSPTKLLADDIFAGRRTEWTHVTAYCIDAPSATDIDDGISLERTDDPDVFWIHVHVADPASSIRPGSPLAELAARLPQTVYLPGHFERMFPHDAVRERFSLDAGRPCLTFSAKVHRRGAVLDSCITPGQLGRVVFITPDEVASVVTRAEAEAVADVRRRRSSSGSGPELADMLLPPSQLALPVSTTSFAVGTPPAPAAAASSRHMATAAELGAEDRSDLETLSALATALRAARLANGAMPLYWPRPSVEVSLDSTAVDVWVAGEARDGKEEKPANAAADHVHLQCSGDPYIRIWYEGQDDSGHAAASAGAGSRLVESLMRLAGEVAADWCHARGISIPFRGQPDAAPHLERLRFLTRQHMYPALSRGRRPSEAVLREVQRLLGADTVTAHAVPHVTMGVPRYTKATSPLRRFSDLVVHWQIEGVLQRELAEGGGSRTSLTPPSLTPSGAPFSLADMEHRLLPMLRMRERALRMLDNRAGRDQWMLQALVRAWTGSPADRAAAPVPSPLRFTVSGVAARKGLVMGRLDWFERAAVMDLQGLNSPREGAPLPVVSLDHVLPGQVFPVVLEHVDVHGNRVLVRRVGAALT